MALDRKRKWIIFWFFILSSIFVIGLESVEVDDLCDTDDSFLKRVNGDWVCSGFLDTNATTECASNEVLLGDGTCYGISNFTGPGSSSYDLNITNGTDEISILDSEFLTFAGGDNVYVESSGNTVTINTQAGGDADTNESERVDNLVYWDCDGTDKVTGTYDNGTLICDTDQEGVDTTCNGVACDLSDDTGYDFIDLDFAGTTGFDDNIDNDTKPYSTVITITSLVYSGQIVSSSLTGYEAADSACNNVSAGSHLCTEFEIVAYQRGNNNYNGLSGNDTWIIAGAPKYVPATIPVSDCNGWTHGSAGTYLGNYWKFSGGGGVGAAVHCGTELKLSCCN